jgi:hypothetical protein
MTMVRPCRLITRQRSHMGLTDGRTFMSGISSNEGCARANASHRGSLSYQDPYPIGQDPGALGSDRDSVLEMSRE